MKTAYKLARLARNIEIEQQFYHEKLQEIIQNYAIINDDGQFIPTEDRRGVKIKPGSEVECEQNINELLELEVELPDIFFSINDFDGIELTTEQMMVMLPFITD